MPQHINISAIQFDSATQIRAEIHNDTVAEYADRMLAGDEFPPVVVFAEPRIDSYLIGDGWHRLLAAQRAGALTFPADVRRGGRIEAIRFALGANVTHGLRRSAADKRKAAEVALREFPDLSDRAIAEACAVSHTLISQVRRQLADSASSDNRAPGPVQVATVATCSESEPTARTGRDGKTYPGPAPKRQTSSPPPEAVAPTPEPIAEPLPPPAPPKYTFAPRRDAIVAFIDRQLAEAPPEFLSAVKQVFRDAVAAKCSDEKPAADVPQWGDRKVIPPLPAWVTAYSASIDYPMDGQKWCDGYEQKRWSVGKVRMSDWQAACRNWKSNGWGLGSITLGKRPQGKSIDYTKKPF